VQDPSLDPTEVSFLDDDPHDGNLYPKRLTLPLHQDPISESARGVPGRPRYGYPLCWSRPGFEWCPYLPAVASFHYPIFRGMTSAKIVRAETGWKLRDEDIFLWSSVEFVMLRAIEAAGSR